MRECSAFGYLSALVDGELSGQQERQMREHSEECPSCRTQLDGLTALKRSVGRAYEGETPSTARRRAVRAAAKRRRQRP